jgi:hypothetical protein
LAKKEDKSMQVCFFGFGGEGEVDIMKEALRERDILIKEKDD